MTYGYRRAFTGMLIFWGLSLLSLFVNLLGLLCQGLLNSASGYRYHTEAIFECFRNIPLDTKRCWALRKPPEGL